MYIKCCIHLSRQINSCQNYEPRTPFKARRGKTFFFILAQSQLNHLLLIFTIKSFQPGWLAILLLRVETCLLLFCLKLSESPLFPTERGETRKGGINLITSLMWVRICSLQSSSSIIVKSAMDESQLIFTKISKQKTIAFLFVLFSAHKSGNWSHFSA